MSESQIGFLQIAQSLMRLHSNKTLLSNDSGLKHGQKLNNLGGITMSKRRSNVYKRKDGRWEGRYIKSRKIDGTAIYSSVYGKSYNEVKNKLSAAQTDSTPDTAYVSNNQTLAEVMTQWLHNNSIRIKGGTYAKYQTIIRTHLAPDIGKIGIRDIDSSLINMYLIQKMKSGRLDGKGGLSPSYVQTMMLIINSTLRFAVSDGLRPPLKTPVLKPSVPKHELEIMSLEDQKRLESHILKAPDLTKIGIMISMQTGMRIGEVCGLQKCDIDMNKGIIHVRHTIARVLNEDNRTTRLIIDTPKTRASVRDIPISEKLFAFLESTEKLSKYDFVISSSDSFVNPRTFEYRFHSILKECGLRQINFHVLRHTFATRCIEAGVDIKSLSEILGHSNVSITLNTYVHSSIEMKRTQLQKLNSL